MLPSLLCAWMPIKEMRDHKIYHQKRKNDIFSLTEDYEPGDQVVYLDNMVSRISEESVETLSNNRPNRYGTVYSEPYFNAPAAHPDYSYDIELTAYNENENDPYYQQEGTVSPIDCKNENFWHLLFILLCRINTDGYEFSEILQELI